MMQSGTSGTKWSVQNNSIPIILVWGDTSHLKYSAGVREMFCIKKYIITSHGYTNFPSLLYVSNNIYFFFFHLFPSLRSRFACYVYLRYYKKLGYSKKIVCNLKNCISSFQVKFTALLVAGKLLTLFLKTRKNCQVIIQGIALPLPAEELLGLHQNWILPCLL